MTNNITNGDSVTQSLGKLYRKYGYSRYKMNKFEEYDTYVENKDFLISDRVITFTDVSGKLLAMKPDVTISIIKNTEDKENLIHKMYYKENVYRVSPGSHAFKEIMQMGLECVGAIDSYSICEVIMLAAKSLESISPDFVLDISHMGFVSAVLADANFTSSEMARALNAIGEKNLPELMSLCKNKSLSSQITEKIAGLVSICGNASDVIESLNKMYCTDDERDAISSLRSICEVIDNAGMGEKIKIDFSVVNDMNYYNGIVFRGYIEGIPTGVLSGGQYDKLMQKMGKKSKALGFALYLDLLEMLENGKNEFDTDVLVVYDDSVPAAEIFSKVTSCINDNKTVIAAKNIPDNLRYKEIIEMRWQDK